MYNKPNIITSSDKGRVATTTLMKIKFAVLSVGLLFALNGYTYPHKLAAKWIASDYIFELISDCLGEEKIKEIVDSLPLFDDDIGLVYDLDGNLVEILTGYALSYYEWAYFLESEWEQIFDYFQDLPPMPLLNPSEYSHEEHKYFNLNTKNVINNLKSIYFESNWRFRGNFYDSVCPKNKPPYEWFKKNLYNYDFKIRDEHPDSLFGEMKWHELRAYNSGKLEKFKSEMISPEDFKKDGYSWKKIPINMYTVNIQMPTGTTIYIAPDSLSASCIFPDSTRISIQYTKGVQSTKLWDGEKDPRKRVSDGTRVTDKYVFSSGVFIDNNKETFWTRIRYRYGITITMYSSPIKKPLNDYIDYQTIVLRTATIVMRPKYKNIYLKD